MNESTINDIDINDTLIDIMDDLIEGVDGNEFKVIYKNLPFNIYYSIEQLSYSRSSLHKDVCDKARIITEKFHKTFK